MSILSFYCSLKLITAHPLNRDQKIKSILHFARWQIGSRLINRPVVYDWVNGSRFMVKKGEIGLTGNIYAGLHEFPDMGFLLHVLRPDDLFIDVGANAGSYTILACSAIGASGYAFEPVPSTYEKLIENIHLNYLENRVKCFNIGVGKEEGNLAFTTNLDIVNHAIASGEHSDNTINVEVSTLDLILENESPTLMKIDVEGFETPVLEGASETLKKQSLHSVIMELNGSCNRYGFDESRILEMMFDYRFKTYSYNPLDRTLKNLQGKNLKSGNTLFIRDESFVMDRLKSSPKINIHGKQF